MIDEGFWRSRRVFLTGHTGFKGAWLALWLKKLGASVYGYSLAPEQDRGAYLDAGLADSMGQSLGDIADQSELVLRMREFDPHIVIHMAAQSLVKLSYEHPEATFSTNIMGLVNCLAGLAKCPSLEAVVIVTSDKCYKNQELESGYREDHPLGGSDPYSSSKACAELVTASWYKSFVQYQASNGGALFGMATARAGNVIGGGDWARDRLVPDVLRAVEQGVPIEIRSPGAVRPWQYVLEPLAGYLLLAQKLSTDASAFSEPWNFGPDKAGVKTVGYVVDELLHKLGVASDWHVRPDPAIQETIRLQLDCSKSGSRLDWQPIYDIDESIERIVSWYKQWKLGRGTQEFMLNEIEEYMRRLVTANE